MKPKSMLCTVLVVFTLFSSFLLCGSATGTDQNALIKTSYIPGVADFFSISIFQAGRWSPVGRLYFNEFPSTQRLLLPTDLLTGAQVAVRVEYAGQRGAQIDAILINGAAPVQIYGADGTKQLAIRKVSNPDHDLIDAGGRKITLFYDAPDDNKAWLELTARIEPEQLLPGAFKFPLENTSTEITPNSAFYTYAWDSQPGRLRVNGELEDEILGEPFLAEFLEPGSGHPDGTIYVWVRNDDRNLYVAADFVPDNTQDSDKDYMRVHLNTPSGVQEFNLSVPEQRWGKPGFTYTSRADYQHKVYEFGIPVAALDLDGLKAGDTLQLAFAAYGTVAIPPLSYPAPYDRTFSDDGYQVVDFSGAYDAATDVAIQRDGKILVSGFSDLGLEPPNFAVARLWPNGNLDNSFSGDGKVIISFGLSDEATDQASSIAVQEDDKILVAGTSDLNFALLRLLPNGIPDIDFDTDGKVTTDLGGNDFGNDMLIQHNGKIVVAGSSDGDFALARYTITGTLDTDFGTAGIVTTDLGGDDVAHGIVEQEDGMLVVVGESSGNFAVVRYDHFGDLDLNFDSDGVVLTDMGVGNDYAHAVALQEDGKIVVAGSSGIAFALARYTTTGQLDVNFDGDGRVSTIFLNGFAIAYNIAVMPDGKIVAGGRHANYFAVARYESSGSLDVTFGDGGRANTVGRNLIGIGYGMAIQPDRKIIIVGDSESPSDFGVLRLAPPTIFLPLVMQ
jgi:uncharacterized delta-60 repeat protein